MKPDFESRAVQCGAHTGGVGLGEDAQHNAAEPVSEPRPGPVSTCIESINGERHVRLSFQIKVF